MEVWNKEKITIKKKKKEHSSKKITWKTNGENELIKKNS